MASPALELFNLEWTNVKGILEDLENLFTCEVCGSPVNNPCTLGGCEHFFCKCCIEEVGENKCPVCQVPSHAKDVQPNRQIANAVSMCGKIKQLINASGDFQLTPERNSTIEAPSSSFYVEYSMTGFSKSSPVATRTRGIDQKRPVVKTPVPGSSGSSSSTSTKTKQPEKKPGKSEKKPAKQKKTLPAAVNVNLDSRDETSEDDMPINQTLNTAKRKIVRTTKQRRWSSSADAQDEEKENSRTSTASKTPRNSAQPRKSVHTSADSSASTPGSDAPVLSTPTPSSSRRRSATASTDSKKRNSRSGASSSSLPLTPTVQSTPGRQSTPSRSIRVSSPATPSSRVKKNAKGETPLHVAAIKGDLERVRELLQEGASPNVKDNAGWTPLHEAVNHGFAEIATLLIDSGALLNVPGMDNDTPLHDAVVNDQLECVKLLVNRGANMLARNIYGRTPADVAVSAEMKSLLKASQVSDRQDHQEDENEVSFEIHQVVVVATGLSREQKIKLQKCCSLLHWKLVEDFLPEVTHVVSAVNKDGMCPRTMKYLNAILTGKWIVNFEWVEMCIGFKQRVCEEAFEVPGTSTCPDTLAPQRARKNFQKQCPGLLDGCHFYLQGEFNYPTPEKDELQKLIKVGGGRMVTREIKADILEESDIIVPYHAEEGSAVSHFIIHDKKNSEPRLISPRLASVPFSWLLDSIAQFKLIPVQV